MPDGSTFWGLTLWPDDLEGGSSEEICLNWPGEGTPTFIELEVKEDDYPGNHPGRVHLSLEHADALQKELTRRVDDEKVRRKEAK